MAARSLSGISSSDLADVVVQTTHLHAALRGARILLTGATGWFGTWLLDALVALDREAALGLRIVALSRDPARFAQRHPSLHATPAIAWVRGDVRDPALVVDGPFTHVIHGATDASATLNATDPERMFDTIVTGTRNVLRIAAAQRDAKMLLIGSGAVYGPRPSGTERLHESSPLGSDPLTATSAYAEGKRAAEHLAAIYASRGLHVTIARCFAFVGPHMPFDAHFAIGNFVRDALDAEAIRIAGDGTSRRSYLYASDLVVWLLTILVDGVPLRPYNVGAEPVVTIRELAELCAATSGRARPIVVAGRAGGSDYVPDTTRARGELGLAATVSLPDAVRRTMAWRQRQMAMQAA